MKTGLQAIFTVIICLALGYNLSATTYYSQGDDDFSNTGNWNDAPGGGGSNPAAVDLTSGAHDFIIQDGHTVTLDTNATVASLTVGSPGAVAGNLVFGDDNSGDTLTIAGAFTVATNAAVTVSANNGTHLIIAQGAITNNGTLNLRNSFAQICNLQLNGTFAIGGTPTLTKLGGFQMIAGTVTSSIPLDIDGNVLLSGGTWVGGGLRHEVSGNWQLLGGNYSYVATDTIDFNTTIVTILDGGTEYFANVLISGGGVFSASNSMVVTGGFHMSNGSQFTSGTTQYFRGNAYDIDAGCEYSQTTASWTYFDGSPTITLNLDGDVDWYYVLFDNGAPNTKDIASGTFDAQDRVYIYNDAIVNGAGNYEMGWMRIDGTCNWSGSVRLTGGTTHTNNADGQLQIGTADIVIAGSCQIQANDTLTVAGDVTIESGYWLFYQNTFVKPDAPATRNFVQNGGTRLYMRGTDVFPSADFIFDLDANSFQRFDQNFTQYARGGITYGHIETYGVDDSLIFTGNTTIAGYLNPYGGSDHVVDFGPYEHHIKGYIYNTTTANRDKKIISTGTIYLDGRGTQVLYDAATATGGG
ncbi:MAG: hypothetical protein MRY83_06550, partial [Flavobacteriales bacterium]|nr:hypothetical protein [Flavobacteriales bacterium]